MSMRLARAAPTPRRAKQGKIAAKGSPGLVNNIGIIHAVALLSAYLMGRALPGAQIAPFGVAFIAAVAGLGLRGWVPAILAVATFAGAASAIPREGALWVGFALALCLIVGRVVRLGHRAPAQVGAAVLAGASAVVAALPVYGSAPPVEVVFWSGVSAAMAQVFLLGMVDLVARREDRRPALAHLVPAVVLLASALSGLEGLALTDLISVHDLAAGFVVLAAAYLSGPAGGTIVAGVLGISFLFSLIGGGDTGILFALPETRAMAYLVGGTLAGAFRDLGKVGVALAYCLGFVTYTMVSTTETRVTLVLGASAAAAAGLFLITPATWNRGWLRLLNPSDPEPAAPSADRASPPAAEVFTAKLKRMTELLKEISVAVDAEVKPRRDASPDLERAEGEIISRLCSKCSMQRQCWEADVDKTRALLSGLWQAARESDRAQTPPDGLDQHCIYPAQLVGAVRHVAEIRLTEERWERRVRDARRLITVYARAMSHMAERFGSARLAVSAAGCPTAYQIKHGTAQVPRRGSMVSGDSCIGTQIGSDLYLLGLSDGMGVGREAAQESSQCLSLVHRLLEAGLGTEVAVNTVNAVFLNRASGEAFVTLDLLVFDLDRGQGEFVKVGAPPTYLKRGHDVTMVTSPALPAGILPDIEMERQERMLLPGDIVVMVSDGIWDAVPESEDKDGWILSHLRRETETNPEVIAEGLLARALEIMPDNGDDMTVLVARVESDRSHGAPGKAGSLTDGWVAARRARRQRTKTESE